MASLIGSSSSLEWSESQIVVEDAIIPQILFSSLLSGAGFTKLDERQSWSGNIVAGGKYFYSRNKSTIVAFTVGSQYTPGGEFKVSF